MSRMVWSLNPAADKSLDEGSLGGVAAIGLAAQVETQWPGPAVGPPAARELAAALAVAPGLVPAEPVQAVASATARAATASSRVRARAALGGRGPGGGPAATVSSARRWR